ncbi:hypothetical protein M422DRAFT_261629, partial [Sphaerobolus stellatus SS14]
MAPKVTLFSLALPSSNPPKIVILLEELGVEYTLIRKERDDVLNGVKAEDFLKISPNGCVPALVDHTNNDFVIWESAAILLYIAERFDPLHKLIGKTLEERAEVWEWLMYQTSGLGPMQAQLFWFKVRHPVKNLDRSVYDRYENEAYRIFDVLEKHLEKHEWVALDKFTVAGMS